MGTARGVVQRAWFACAHTAFFSFHSLAFVAHYYGLLIFLDLFFFLLLLASSTSQPLPSSACFPACLCVRLRCRLLPRGTDTATLLLRGCFVLLLHVLEGNSILIAQLVFFFVFFEFICFLGSGGKSLLPQKNAFSPQNNYSFFLSLTSCRSTEFGRWLSRVVVRRAKHQNALSAAPSYSFISSLQIFLSFSIYMFVSGCYAMYEEIVVRVCVLLF